MPLVISVIVSLLRPRGTGTFLIVTSAAATVIERVVIGVVNATLVLLVVLPNAPLPKPAVDEPMRPA